MNGNVYLFLAEKAMRLRAALFGQGDFEMALVTAGEVPPPAPNTKGPPLQAGLHAPNLGEKWWAIGDLNAEPID